MDDPGHHIGPPLRRVAARGLAADHHRTGRGAQSSATAAKSAGIAIGPMAIPITKKGADRLPAWNSSAPRDHARGRFSGAKCSARR
ncbi:hypothetical protein BYZ73_06435 [Rhodovulum viride]|uniref:Uncharacterized protein n=1 Tax=Rhodovulum viride TaxID=1231134 RepID=A0ABX9DK96_9RHOB|nr:hypothetical protein BYZ73_06435 [Rhodovulum viride]